MTGQSRAEPWNQITQGILDVLGEKAQPHQRPGQGNGSVEGCVGRRSEICLEWKRLSSPTATLYPSECVTLVRFYFYKQDPEFPYWSHLPLGYYTSMWGSARDNDIHLPGQLFGSRTGESSSHKPYFQQFEILCFVCFRFPRRRNPEVHRKPAAPSRPDNGSEQRVTCPGLFPHLPPAGQRCSGYSQDSNAHP